MKVGGKRRLEIPQSLGYGSEGLGKHVPPDSRLIFEVELLDVKPPFPPARQTSVEGIEPVVLPSGVKYWDIKKGTGRPADLSAIIKAHYAGWLEDGALFDSSYERGQPLQVRLGRMILGWGEGLQDMRVGGRRRLEIPYTMGFGVDGQPPVPPKAKLVYEIELLDVMY
jgi:peptidylprolyl isomerase